MVKINKKLKDKKLRKRFLATELKRRYYKVLRLVSLKSGDKSNYIKYQSLLSKLPQPIITNYCYLTGRGRGVYRKFRLSRHQIKDKFRFLTGLTNSSW